MTAGMLTPFHTVHPLLCGGFRGGLWKALILGSPGFLRTDYLCGGRAIEDSEWQMKGLSPLAGYMSC